MKKKLFALLMAGGLSVCGLAACNGAEQEGQCDPTLYHLTLKSNIDLDNEQKAMLKATYGYGEPSETIVEGVRDEDEVAALIEAGATEEDIAKAGKRQEDGSYYFFEGDPIYIETPAVAGYKMKGIYEDGNFIYRPGLTKVDGKDAQARWNMEQKDVELEARYEKWSYTISFDFMEDTDTNPNSNITKYCYLDDGVVTLQPATTTNKHKKFVCWEYQDTTRVDQDGYALWVEIKDGVLPADYDEEYMRIHAKFEIESYKITFAFEEYVDPELSNNLTWEDAVDSMAINGNITTIDGVKEKCDGTGTSVTKDSVIYTEYGSWMNIFTNIKSNYEVWYIKLNGVRCDNFISGQGIDRPYVSIYEGDITKDTEIRFVLTAKIL